MAVSYLKLAGKNYPLSFSLGASKRIAQKYGSINKIEEKLTFEELTEETIDVITDLVELLINQGCAYKNVFEKNLPAEKDAPIVDGKYIPLSREEIEIVIGFDDFDNIIEAIMRCVNSSAKTEIEVETGKNSEAPEEMS